MLTPRERERLIKQLWSGKHRDFRSKRGDESHPAILALGPRGTTLIPLHGASDEELIALRDTGYLPRVESQGRSAHRGGGARGACRNHKGQFAKCRGGAGARALKTAQPGEWNVYAGGILKNSESPFSPGTLSPYNGELASVDIRPPGEGTYSPWMVQLRVLLGKGWGQQKFASAKGKAAAERLAAQWTRKYLET